METLDDALACLTTFYHSLCRAGFNNWNTSSTHPNLDSRCHLSDCWNGLQL